MPYALNRLFCSPNFRTYQTIAPITASLRGAWRRSNLVSSTGLPRSLRSLAMTVRPSIILSFSAKIGTRRLLAQGILRAGLPIPCGTVATGSELLLSAPRHFVPITVARQQGNLTPFRSRVPPNNKKSPAFTGRLGIKEHINPHMVLTPKTVRETSSQVFWLSHPCPPSQLRWASGM